MYLANTKIFNKCIDYANKYHDGHFTLLKFTTNWRFCFSTFSEIDNIITDQMVAGKTPEEAMENGLFSGISAEDIEGFLGNEDDYFKGKEYVAKQPLVGKPKIGRNSPCPCGSEKKYKKCCGQGRGQM